MDAYGRHNLVALRVDDTYVRRAAIDDVDLVLPGVGGNPRRRSADLQRFRQAEGAKVDHRNGVAFSIRNVRVLVIGRAKAGDLPLVEVPPAQTCQYWQKHQNEENLAQESGGRARSATRKRYQKPPMDTYVAGLLQFDLEFPFIAVHIKDVFAPNCKVGRERLRIVIHTR